jgi:two-component system NarL family response regulator
MSAAKPMTKPIRVIVVDDHALFRQGLRSLLRLHADIDVVAEVDKASDLRATLAEVGCDILLLDLQMERWMLDDVASLSQLARVVVLTASERIEDGIAAMRLGARAVVQKRFAIETLTEAIRAVADGLVWMPPALQTEVAAQWGVPAAMQLTARERDIVRCVALGLRNAEVAKQLAISEATVKTHLNNVFQKLGLRDRMELYRYALRVGLVTLRE